MVGSQLSKVQASRSSQGSIEVTLHSAPSQTAVPAHGASEMQGSPVSGWVSAQVPVDGSQAPTAQGASMSEQSTVSVASQVLPTQVPARAQWSLCGRQLDPSGSGADLQVPVPESQKRVKQGRVVLGSQTGAREGSGAQTPPWQVGAPVQGSPSSSQAQAASSPSTQPQPGAPVGSPTQTPESQTSPTVQGSPSTQGSSASRSWAMHAPTSGSQTQAVHGVAAGQVMTVSGSTRQTPAWQVSTPVQGSSSPWRDSQV